MVIIYQLIIYYNQIARSLKTSKTQTIGVIIPGLSDVYSTTIVKSIEKELYQNGYNIFVCDSSGNIDLEKEKVSILLDKMVDGLIIYPCSEDISYLQGLMKKKWLIRDKEDKTNWASNFMMPGYHQFCFNTQYLDYLIKQIEEVVKNYDADGNSSIQLESGPATASIV